MNKKRSVLIVVLLVIVSLFCCFLYNKKDVNVKTYEETKKIKSEYEALNGTTRESDKQTYGNVEIDDTIEVDIVSSKEAVDFIKNGTGILFIGAPWCPWCRNALPILMDVAKTNSLVIKYIDITDIRNVFEIKNGKLVKTQKEGEGYYELLSSLDSVLGDSTYKLKDSNGKEYDTKEKRIYMPSAIAINNGEIKGTHVSTVKLNDNQTKYSKLESNQVEELKSIYQDLINKTKGLNVCSNETMCD